MDIKKREIIWIALSCFYIDNELQEQDFKYIVTKIKESQYSFNQVKKIDKEEVFPVLYPNLLHPTGVSHGFNEDWLVNEITKKLQKRSILNQFTNTIRYARLKWIYTDSWKVLDATYHNS